MYQKKKLPYVELELRCFNSYENKVAFVHECNTMDINYLDGTYTKTTKLLFTNNKSMSFFYKTN